MVFGLPHSIRTKMEDAGSKNGVSTPYLKAVDKVIECAHTA
jgi:hypothetical protein